MIVSVPYGESSIEVVLPDRNYAGTLEPGVCNVLRDVTACIGTRLAESRFGEFLDGASKVLVIANDSFRSTPSTLAFEALRPCLAEVSDLRVLIATGLHRSPTPEETGLILGDEFRTVCTEVLFSDASDRSQFYSVGTWENGAEILIHRMVRWADRIIVIGSIEPHYFAGFTGGPKSLMPGIAHQSTIRANHSLATDSACRPAKLDGNPVAESIREAAGRLDASRIYSIQFVSDSRRNVVDVFTGGLWESFEDGVNCAREVYMLPVPSRCEVVIAAAESPLDRNLYQLQKSFENARSAVQDGGSLVVVSACSEGIGNDEFFRLADRYPLPDDVLGAGPDNSELGFHKLYRTALHRGTIDISVKSELDDDVVRKVYLEPIGDLQRQLDREIEKYGDNSRVLFIRDAGHVVPFVDRPAPEQTE